MAGLISTDSAVTAPPGEGLCAAGLAAMQLPGVTSGEANRITRY
jgi:hypothetical protein